MEKKYQIKYVPSAEQDLIEIIDYVLQDDPEAAINLLNQIDESISILGYFPNRGTIPKDIRLQALNYRVIINGNYLIFYVVFDDMVEIRRVLHAKRRYEFLL